MTDCNIDVLDHGYVKLLDVMGDDAAIDQAARTSYDSRGKGEVRKLIRSLMRRRHTSPFEMAELKFEVKMPIHVARQWHRHRTASINEVSARYTTLPAEMYVPQPKHIFAKKHDDKQGRGGFLNEGNKVHAAATIRVANADAYDAYEHLLAGDVAPETARGNLPLNVYTTFVWKLDLHNLMHFLNLRCDSHAQWEIRQYANVIETMTTSLFPLSMEAWGDYIFRSHTLSRWAMAAVQDIFKEITYGKLNQEAAMVKVHAAMVPEHMTQREWFEDVIPVTEVRF